LGVLDAPARPEGSQPSLAGQERPRSAIAAEATKGELLAFARAVLAGRRNRFRMLAGVDFGEPAWDILLDLFISAGEERRVSVTGACVVCSVPPTTALRQVGLLVAAGYLRRIPDETDRRRVFLQLSEEAQQRMAECLRRMLRQIRTGTGA
jgi:MarR family